MKRWIIGTVILVVLGGCLPNRLPPEPIEQQRPRFVRILSPSAVFVEDPSDSSLLQELRLTAQTGFPVSLNPTFQLGFTEPMDILTFPGNVFLTHGTDTINGTYSGGTLGDTLRVDDTLFYVVTFTPTSGTQPPNPPMNTLDPLTSYFLTILGSVKDTAGNSVSIDTAYSVIYEFATEDGTEFPRVLLADRTNGTVMAVDTFHLWTFTDVLSQPTEMLFLPSGQKVVITDEENTSGFLKVFDALGNAVDSVKVGARQNGICSWNGQFVVSTKSPRAYYVVDEATLTVVDSGQVSVTPKRVAMNDSYIYLLSTTRAILAINRQTGEDTVIAGALNPPLRSPNMVVNDNGIVAVNDYSGGRLLFLQGLDTSYVYLSGYHPTDITPDPTNLSIFWVGTDEGILLEVNMNQGTVNEYPEPSAIASLGVYLDYMYLYLPDLEAGGTTGYLVLLDPAKNVLRGIPVGTTVSRIYLFPEP